MRILCNTFFQTVTSSVNVNYAYPWIVLIQPLPIFLPSADLDAWHQTVTLGFITFLFIIHGFCSDENNHISIQALPVISSMQGNITTLHCQDPGVFYKSRVGDEWFAKSLSSSWFLILESQAICHLLILRKKEKCNLFAREMWGK